MKKKIMLLSMAILLGAGAVRMMPTEQNTIVKEVYANEEKIVVIDDLGREVEIPANLERIVVADLPGLVHTYYAVNGSTEGLVGGPKDNALTNNLLPSLYPEVSEISTSFKQSADLNIEELLTLKPDLILYRADIPETVEMIQNTGVPCVAFRTFNLDNGNTITPVASWYDMIATILGKETNSGKLSKYAHQSVGFVQSRIWDIPQEKTMAYMTFTPEALKIAGPGVFGSFWSEIIHVEDLGMDFKSSYTVISIEELYKLDPEIIFSCFSSMTPEEIMSNPLYANLTAVKNGAVYEAPEGVFTWYGSSTDVPVSAIWHAKMAYPEEFADIDVVEITERYYKEMYEYTLTEQDIQDLFTSSLEQSRKLED